MSSAVARPGRRPGPTTSASCSWSRIRASASSGLDLLDVVLGQRHRRRLDDLGREQRLERLGDGQRDQAGAGPAGGPADEQGRAGVVERAGDHEQLAERALVAARPVARAAARRRSRRRAPRARPASRPCWRAPRPAPLRRCPGQPRSASAASARSRSIRARIRRSRSSSRSSMSGGKTYRPPVGPDAEGDRDGVLGLVADRHRDPLHPELLRPGGRAAVEPDRRLAGRQPLDLDVAPADARGRRARGPC